MGRRARSMRHVVTLEAAREELLRFPPSSRQAVWEYVDRAVPIRRRADESWEEALVAALRIGLARQPQFAPTAKVSNR